VTNESSGGVADATLHEFISHQKLFGRYTLIKLASKEIAIALHRQP